MDRRRALTVLLVGFLVFVVVQFASTWLYDPGAPSNIVGFPLPYKSISKGFDGSTHQRFEPLGLAIDAVFWLAVTWIGFRTSSRLRSGASRGEE